jgi:hypothetical protein
VSEKTKATFDRQLNYIDQLLTFYTKLIQNLDSDDDHGMDDQDVPIILLNLKIIQLTSCNLHLINNGYYNDAKNILRNIHETRFLSQYFMKNPDAASRWMDGEQVGYGFVAKQILNPSFENDLYGFLCNFTHSNWPSVINHMDFAKDYPVDQYDLTKMDLLIKANFDAKNAKLLLFTQIVESTESMSNFYRYFNSMYWMKFDVRFGKDREKLKQKYAKILQTYKTFD